MGKSKYATPTSFPIARVYKGEVGTLRFLIDTNIAIEWRDGSASIIARLATLPAPPTISIITQIELDGGVHREPRLSAVRRKRLDLLLAELQVLEFDRSMAAIYREIVAHCVFSRPRILDRLIAATAIANDLTLITINGSDFREIPGLTLEIWPAPAAQ